MGAMFLDEQKKSEMKNMPFIKHMQSDNLCKRTFRNRFVQEFSTNISTEMIGLLMQNSEQKNGKHSKEIDELEFSFFFLLLDLFRKN